MEGLRDGEIRKEVMSAYEAQHEPLATYKKTIVGKVLVKILDPIRLAPAELILFGTDTDEDIDTLTVSVWSVSEDRYLKRENKKHFETGTLVPYTAVEEQKFMVNQITDEEIESILQQPYFALKNKLESFTTTVPMHRFLLMAEKMNRPVKTLEFIKSMIAKLEGMDTVNEQSPTQHGPSTSSVHVDKVDIEY